METVNIYIKIIKEDGIIPIYASHHSAGCDLFATQDMVLLPGETRLMPLNFIIAIDEGVEAQIRPRSGLSLKTSLRIPNSPGTIDADYRNEVCIILCNDFNPANIPYQLISNPDLINTLSANYREISVKEYLKVKGIATSELENLNIFKQSLLIDCNNNPFGTIYIKKGERIAQMIFSSYKKAQFIIHDNPESIGFDRGGGFGHTG